MPTQPVIAVTGSTGAVGGRVARDLAARGIPQRLLVRDASRAPELAGAEVRVAGYFDADAAAAALAGIETLFMVSASESADRVEHHRTFVEAAARAGVRSIVYTSFLAAAPDAVFTLGRDHAATEEIIRASGMSWTFLRDNFYMDMMELFAGDDGVIRGPAGDGRCSLVSRSDVAATAVAVLLDPATHTDTAYDLTGPEALTLAEVAEKISAVRGHPVRYLDETLDEAYASRAVYGAPPWQVDAWVSTYTAIASGDLARVSGDVEAVTGRPAQSFDEFLGAIA
ncbi:MAG: NAD(P)-dependent oxidoreductase [Microbacterium sp. 71-36]|uniref:SDR family oxidoreductase n=1 Tax=unclassified Microbacterium TaxID=2609290 RepID=UPI000868F8BE|nr:MULTISPECIES: SDR family oxidoreductase [unclassified Microbacterium]MBN9209883.1 SDR family oxidoreductase [Microbacterium sp.]ODT38537.1 MAG: NAD(P)-dependent oxidoreductase [Microbacterium sp. SCN 71-17]OJV77867.1 MAG: NAD(P)-dependent oxidoreductase [Microbacterium sp. 71-36]